MANEEVLGPRKTMIVLVIVVGCFAVLWPRILSPLMVGHARDKLQPNQFDRDAAMKQERPPIRGAGPHPALRERGRAIPPGTPPQPSRGSHITLPPNVRPPPIPGMRPPLGSPGGPVPAPKSSMGFVMPIYTICIIVFFVYTISKIFFKRATVPYEPITPDPQFRRRVFRDNSRSSPDKLVVTAISGLVAEVQQQMEASYTQNQQTQDGQDNLARPYTNGTVIHSSGPVHIIATEYREKSPEQKQPSPEPKEDAKQVIAEDEHPDVEDVTPESKEIASETKETLEAKASTPEPKELSPEPKSKSVLEVPTDTFIIDDSNDNTDDVIDRHEPQSEDTVPDLSENHNENLLIDLGKPIEVTKNGDVKHSIDEFIREEVRAELELEDEKTKELLEEAIEEEDQDDEREKSTVKVMGMEMRAASADGGTPPAPPPPPPPAPASAPRSHEAADVKSIFLETEIPQQTRVLVTDFAEDTRDTKPTRHAPMVVSGKMTLSLIQDAPRDTPERDGESTIDDFTTASAYTQNAEKDGVDSEEEEEIDEEVEVEEIEEEIEIDVDISDEENIIEKETENILQRDAEKLIEDRVDVEEDLQDDLEEDKDGVLEEDTQDVQENNEHDAVEEDTQDVIEEDIVEGVLKNDENNVIEESKQDVVEKYIVEDVQENDEHDVIEESTQDVIEKDIVEDVQENDKHDVIEESTQNVVEKDTAGVLEKDIEGVQENDKQDVLKTDTEAVIDKDIQDIEKEVEDLLEEARNNVLKKKGGE